MSRMKNSQLLSLRQAVWLSKMTVAEVVQKCIDEFAIEVEAVEIVRELRRVRLEPCSECRTWFNPYVVIDAEPLCDNCEQAQSMS